MTGFVPGAARHLIAQVGHVGGNLRQAALHRLVGGEGQNLTAGFDELPRPEVRSTGLPSSVAK
jgi:hypothetical protein